METRCFSFARWNEKWNLRRLALLSLPALLIGLILRVMLMVDMPYGGFHPDTAALLYTPHKLAHKHRFKLNPKKTFLSPILYTVAFAVPKAPALIVIPIAQHTMGLVTVGMGAILCRLWFRHWQWVVVPVTLLLAVNPTLIWYEHTLMAETQFVATVTLLALMGTIYAMRPRLWAFTGLCLALVLVAGARPEGKLLFGFGFLLVFLVAWPKWRDVLLRLSLLLMVAIPTHLYTKTSQAGLLLYTSLIRIAPAESKIAPGIEAYTGEIRNRLAEQWGQHPTYPTSSDRRDLDHAVRSYLKDQQLSHGTEDVEKLCSQLAFETCKMRVEELPGVVFHKFKYTAIASPADGFGEAWFSHYQAKAVASAKGLLLKNSEALLGKKLENEEQVSDFITAAYSIEKVRWFDEFCTAWARAVASLRTPNTIYADGYIEAGLPLYMLAAFAGLLLMMRRYPWQFQVAWGLALLGLLFVILLTGNVRARFRLFFEPFWIIYCAALIDSLICLFRRSEMVDLSDKSLIGR